MNHLKAAKFLLETGGDWVEVVDHLRLCRTRQLKLNQGRVAQMLGVSIKIFSSIENNFSTFSERNACIIEKKLGDKSVRLRNRLHHIPELIDLYEQLLKIKEQE